MAEDYFLIEHLLNELHRGPDPVTMEYLGSEMVRRDRPPPASASEVCRGYIRRSRAEGRPLLLVLQDIAIGAAWAADDGRYRVSFLGRAIATGLTAARARRLLIGLVRRTKVPLRRMLLLLRDGACCCYCGVSLSWDAITVEHVVARCDGGTSLLRNLAIACRACNSFKGAALDGRERFDLLAPPPAPLPAGLLGVVRTRLAGLRHALDIPAEQSA